jgi:hypothetical protein
MPRIPDKLYELLPYLYSMAGVAMTIYFETFIGDASGYLLILFAGIIFFKRSDYRKGRVTRKN